MFNEPILELGTEGMQLSDKEEDKRDVKIRRTVVQVTLLYTSLPYIKLV